MSLDTAIPGVLVTSTRPPTDDAEFACKAFLARYRVDATRESYQIALAQWFGWCDEQRINPLDATRPLIELYARQLEMTGRKVSTVAAKLNALAGFYKFAVIDEIIPRDPMAAVRRPHVDRTSTTEGLTRTEFADVLRVLADRPVKELGLLLVLGYTGLRIAEALAIQAEHIGMHQGLRTVHLPHRKGGKSQTLTLAPRTGWVIEQILNGRTTGPVFQSKTGLQMDRKAAARIIARNVKAAGISKRITPHSLRHTYITMALDAKVSERDIAISTGHVDTRMLAYYDRARDSLVRSSIATQAVSAWVESAA